MYKYILAIIVLLSIISCKQTDKYSIDKTINYKSDNINITVILNEVKIVKISDEERKIFNSNSIYKSFIYGKIIVTNNTDKIEIENINNYFLKNNNILSSDINIKSVAYRIIKSDTLNPGQSIIKPVYWVFENIVLKDDIKKIELVYK